MKKARTFVSDGKTTLRRFELEDLARFTKEGEYNKNASKDFHLLFVGKDNVHDALKYVLSRVQTSLYLNMFGYDDDELNDIIFAKVLDPHVTVLITLDKSQSGGVHEKKLLALDKRHNLKEFNSHFVLGQSGTHQISHTKGGVADGIVGFEGSTNWSASGEGIWVLKGAPGGKGFKAQNNTQSFFTDPDALNTFQARLISEHMTARAAVLTH